MTKPKIVVYRNHIIIITPPCGIAFYYGWKCVDINSEFHDSGVSMLRPRYLLKDLKEKINKKFSTSTTAISTPLIDCLIEDCRKAKFSIGQDEEMDKMATYERLFLRFKKGEDIFNELVDIGCPVRFRKEPEDLCDEDVWEKKYNYPRPDTSKDQHDKVCVMCWRNFLEISN